MNKEQKIVYNYLREHPETFKDELKKRFPKLSNNSLSLYYNQYFDNFSFFGNFDFVETLQARSSLKDDFNKLLREHGKKSNKIKQDIKVQFKLLDKLKNNLEKCESPIEKIFYIYISPHFPDIIPQFEIPPYRIDFALDPYRKIGIELDGKIYHDCFDKERSTDKTNKDYDRQLFLERKGWNIIRFTGSQIYNDIQKCINTVKEIRETQLWR